jgi:hypothetical protein
MGTGGGGDDDGGGGGGGDSSGTLSVDIACGHHGRIIYHSAIKNDSRRDGKHFRAARMKKLTAFVELERAIYELAVSSIS